MPPEMLLILMLKIVARLPPKVIFKCKCVSKEWLTYISSIDFLRTHSLYMRDSPEQKIITTRSHKKSCVSRSLNYEEPNYLVGTELNPPFNVHPKNLLFLASLDDMLCISLKNTWDLVLWNPLSGACKMLSNNNKQGFFKAYIDAVGFYVDATFDYNVIHIKRRRGTLAVYVYSLRRASWKCIPFLKKRPYNGDTYDWSMATFCGDALYFRVSQNWLGAQKMLVRFEVNTHRFSELAYPNTWGLGPQFSLVSIRSELHCYVSRGSYERALELWKLHNGSWMKLHTFRYGLCLPLPPFTSLTHYNISGTTLMITGWGHVFEIKLSFNEATNFIPSTFGDIKRGAIYSETILSPGF